jgi:hypothetical protein
MSGLLVWGFDLLGLNVILGLQFNGFQGHGLFFELGLDLINFRDGLGKTEIKSKSNGEGTCCQGQ